MKKLVLDIYVSNNRHDNIFTAFNHSWGTKINNVIINVMIDIGKLKELDITMLLIFILTSLTQTSLPIVYLLVLLLTLCLLITTRLSETRPFALKFFKSLFII